MVLIVFHFNIYLKGILLSAILVGYTLLNLRNPPFSNKKVNDIFITSLYMQVASAVLVLVVYNTSSVIESSEKTENVYQVLTYLVLAILGNFIYVKTII